MFLDSGPVSGSGQAFRRNHGSRNSRLCRLIGPSPVYALRLISSGSGAAAQRATYSLTDA